MTVTIGEILRSRERLVVHGERRMGKTSILRRAIARTKGDVAAIYLDLWGFAGEQDVLRGVLSQIPPSWLVGDRLGSLVTQLIGMATLGVDAAGNPTFSLNPNFQEEGGSSFAHMVGRMNEYAGKATQPIVFVIDEFTKCDDRLGLPPSTLRSLAQSCPELGFVFSGSAVGVIGELLGPSGPFLGTPTLEVRAMDREFFVEWIRDVLRGHARTLTREVGESLVDTCYGITSYALELADAAWSVTQAGQVIEPSGTLCSRTNAHCSRRSPGAKPDSRPQPFESTSTCHPPARSPLH